MRTAPAETACAVRRIVNLAEPVLLGAGVTQASRERGGTPERDPARLPMPPSTTMQTP